MSKFVVHYKMVVQPGRGEELLAIYDKMIRTFDDEPGTEVYLLTRSLEDPDVFWAHELFSSKEAFEEHRATAVADSFVPALKALLVSSEAIQGTAVLASGVDV